ncbi:MAG: type I phosphomannose isomerase catalytic subunit [Roseiflexaceae bacterium]|jgi:mannose-6-phosphate isomerase
MTLYAVRLTRRFESRLWGGHTLAAWLGVTDAPTPLAETWEVYNDNLICNGALRGLTLRQAVQQYGAAFVGQRSFARYGAEFPLLAKFIDAAQPLSVQVHPDDTYAHTHEAASGFHGKTEAWHILAAQPDSDIIHGLIHPISRTHYADAIANGTLDTLLRHVPVQAGDTVFVPAGTIHAINAGIMLFEIQQTSDLTYRVYDYNRRDAHGNLRDLHIDQAIAVSDLGEAAAVPTPAVARGAGVAELVRSEFFVMDRHHATHATSWQRPADTFQIVTLIDGAAIYADAGGSEQLTRGDSLVIPAAIATSTLTPVGSATWLRCWVPPQ